MMQYSKKVIEIFRKPKHVGVIKNPDGYGKVGNPTCGDQLELFIKVKNNKIIDAKFRTYGCIPEGATLNSSKIGENIEVSQLVEGSEILTQKGNDIIKSRFCMKYNGPILELIPQKTNDTLWVTPNHKVFAIKRKDIPKSRKSKHKWLRIDKKNINKNLIKKVAANEISEGDYIIKQFPRFFKKSNLTYNQLKLLGIYLADGWVFGEYKSAINLAINKRDNNLIKEIKKVVKEEYPKAKFSIWKKSRPAIEIYIGSPELAKLCETHCGKYAKQKSLSDEILGLDKEKIKIFLEWYLKGDGYIAKDRRRPNSELIYSVATVSEKLANQLQFLLAKLNLLVSIQKRKHTDSVIEGRKIIGGFIFELKWIYTPKKDQIHLLDNSLFAVPIKQIKKSNFNGFVYDFESESHTLLQKNWLVSNCVAAVAASDALCGLIIGKTIEEALKVTDKDIVNYLENLPAVKFHCSVLGKEGLTKAIENYKNKKK